VAASAASRPAGTRVRRFSPERTIGGVRSDHSHIGHPVANLNAAHAIAELIDFADDVIAHHEWRPAAHCLRVEMASDQHVGVFETRGEHTDPHLAPAGGRQGSVDHFEPVGTAKAPNVNNPVAGFFHGRVPRNSCTSRRGAKRGKALGEFA
jgi:hypothetical protein